MNGFKDNNKHNKIISNGKGKNVADKDAEDILLDDNIPPPKIAPPVFLSAPPPPPPPPTNPPPTLPGRHRQLKNQHGGGNRATSGMGPSVLRSQSMSTADRAQYISGPPPKFRPPPPPTSGLPVASYMPKVYIYKIILHTTFYERSMLAC